MSEISRIRSKLSAAALCLALGATLLPQAMAAGSGDPEQLVDSYLVALANGDVAAILASIDGRMKNKNKALELSPDTYAEFLRNHYQGVQTTVEGISPQADKLRARVRFDYPTSDSSVIVFILSEQDGQWKITNEEF